MNFAAAMRLAVCTASTMAFGQGTPKASTTTPEPALALPKYLAGKWEGTNPSNFRTYGNDLKMTDISVDATGNLSAKFTAYAAPGAPAGNPCNTLVDFPVTGKVDGATVTFAGDNGQCKRNWIFQKGTKHLLEGTSTTNPGVTLYLDPA